MMNTENTINGIYEPREDFKENGNYKENDTIGERQLRFSSTE